MRAFRRSILVARATPTLVQQRAWPALAQQRAWPAQPIRGIVPCAAGTADTVARTTNIGLDRA